MGQHQLAFLANRLEDRSERRNKAAGEYEALDEVDVFQGPLVALFRHVDGLYKRQTIRPEQGVNLGEVAVQELWSNGFDHLDGDQLVELALKITVIVKQEGDTVFQTFLL